MSLRTFLIAGLASLTLSGAALAQSNSATVVQSGGGVNLSNISQSGYKTTNSATVLQDGRFNASNITQRGKVNDAAVVQTGAKYNFSNISQQGTKANSALAIQQGSRLNFSNISQQGGPKAINSATAVQFSNGGANLSNISQRGFTNSAAVGQLGAKFNFSNVLQRR
jgi:hypothetical protein